MIPQELTMHDEILIQMINTLVADIELICRLSALVPLLDDAGSTYFVEAIALLFLIHEIISRVEAQMTALTARRRLLEA
jgi:hypothetical protein